MSTVNGNELMLAIRMRELCKPPTAWNRALWTVSSYTSLKEVLEAAKVRRDGILSNASLLNLQHSTSILIGKDVGVGSDSSRRSIQNRLQSKSIITPGSLDYSIIEQSIQEKEAGYLQNWAVRIDKDLPDELIEQCARCVVSHLLDGGHSRESVSDCIHGSVLSENPSVSSAGNMIRQLDLLTKQPSEDYTAVFPVVSAPDSGKTKSEGWMDGGKLVEWMKLNNMPAFQANERVCGAVTFTLVARDRQAAEHIAATRFVALRDRAVLGARKAIDSLGFFWLSGSINRASIIPPDRGVEVASIRRQDMIYSVDESNPGISRAISLLAELDHGPTSAAVTSGWAAMESLAMGPAEEGDRVETAVRIAQLLTASFVRAELTTLAYSYVKSNKNQTATDIKMASNNRERCEIIMNLLLNSQQVSFGRLEDAAGAKRIVQLLGSPAKTLLRINQYIEATFRRLYRLRNLVAHGGRTDSIVLEAGVLAAAPLIGAAVDRMHHASTFEGLGPVELIARAQRRIGLLEESDKVGLISLLDQ